MTPLGYYQQQLDAGLIQKDDQQLEIMQLLQNIFNALMKQQSRSSISRKLFSNKPVKGLYAWGSVGVGKTFLMDCFYICYPYRKMRMHFHVFMQRIQEDLTRIQGQVNPLKKVAKQIASEASVICFDEFFVKDIADAMILAELFEALFAEGVCLITTSNIEPDGLYKDGLQRERFLPAIELIKANTTVFHMISHHDYRLTHLQEAGVYFSPINAQTDQYMKNAFTHLAEDQTVNTSNLMLFDREIQTRARTDAMIWFDFENICGVPRSQKDFIGISKQYHTVFISQVPVLGKRELNLSTSFINLIDVFYDANVRVVISAAADIEALYPEGQLKFEFARTQSRLIEMQSTDYFNQRERK